jgi:hypothetical protein
MKKKQEWSPAERQQSKQGVPALQGIPAFLVLCRRGFPSYARMSAVARILLHGRARGSCLCASAELNDNNDCHVHPV